MNASREAGWRGWMVDGQVVDLCPACALDVLPGLVCPFPEPCGYAIANWIGHDPDGHRIARYLVREFGLKSVREVLNWERKGWLRELPVGTRARLFSVSK
ncbi:hypothetical protein ACFRMO_08075 [Streptomyces anulatus]|uniref:hypothetical protein n=1 Tax=Streptomyces anulatus TaxID=1892 RepID=UPI0036AAADB1